MILSDSHGKNLGTLIEQRTSLNVCSYVRSGAQFEQVVEEVKSLGKDLTTNDYLLVIGGTNDVESRETIHLTDRIHSLIRESAHTNLILASIPMRIYRI